MLYVLVNVAAQTHKYLQLMEKGHVLSFKREEDKISSLVQAQMKNKAYTVDVSSHSSTTSFTYYIYKYSEACLIY